MWTLDSLLRDYYYYYHYHYYYDYYYLNGPNETHLFVGSPI